MALLSKNIFNNVPNQANINIQFMKEPVPHIDVCIPTYRRPKLLLKLIESLTDQDTQNLFTYSLIIVDNDPKQSAEKIIKDQENTSIVISYYCQAKKNISLTRNLAVQKSNGEYLAFIDDDEYACKDWLLKLYLCQRKYGADCVQGPVISYFPTDTQRWIIRSNFFNRKRFKTGTQIYFGRTGNCLISSKIIKQFDNPFDPGFGLTGGEDTAFFSEIIKRKHNITWCDEAEAYEYVGHNRTNLEWILKRSLRGGNCYIIHKNQKKQIATRIINLNISLAKFIIVLVLSPMSIIIGIFDIKFLIKTAAKLSGYYGQIIAFWGYEYKEYK